MSVTTVERTPELDTQPAEFARNQWYAAAWQSEVDDRIVPRRILNEPLILFRTADGSISALYDRCPHRFAPLSMGECVDGTVQCGYHGLQFGGDGVCLQVPGQQKIPHNARVRSFPVVERYGLAWVWMGAAAADESLLPEISRFDAPGWDRMIDGYQLHQTNYRNVVENLMDPAHTTFLHKATIANPLAEQEPVKVERDDDHVVAYRWLERSKPSPNDLRAGQFTEDDVVDRAQFFYYYPPSVSRVDICVMGSGEPHDDEHMDQGMRTLSYKFVTPESTSSTHIFWMHLRNYRLGDVEFEAILRTNLEKTFWEDNDICAAIQKEQDVSGKRQEVSLSIDRAPRLAMQMINRQIGDEAGV